MANWRYAVAAADWMSVDGAWTSWPEGTVDVADQAAGVTARPEVGFRSPSGSPNRPIRKNRVESGRSGRK